VSEPFAVVVASRADEFVVRPVGDLDETAMSTFDRAIDASIDVDPARIAVDLREVSGLDLDGLRSLLRARIVAQAHEIPLRFADPSAACRRLTEGSLGELLGFETR
jgi:anti-anti-sigma regulatory factor